MVTERALQRHDVGTSEARAGCSRGPAEIGCASSCLLALPSRASQLQRPMSRHGSSFPRYCVNRCSQPRDALSGRRSCRFARSSHERTAPAQGAAASAASRSSAGPLACRPPRSEHAVGHGHAQVAVDLSSGRRGRRAGADFDDRDVAAGGSPGTGIPPRSANARASGSRSRAGNAEASSGSSSWALVTFSLPIPPLSNATSMTAGPRALRSSSSATGYVRDVFDCPVRSGPATVTGSGCPGVRARRACPARSGRTH